MFMCLLLYVLCDKFMCFAYFCRNLDPLTETVSFLWLLSSMPCHMVLESFYIVVKCLC